MAHPRHRHRLENLLYGLAAVLGVVGLVGFATSYFSYGWDVRYPVLPYFLVVLAGLSALAAVVMSLARFFQQDQVSQDPLTLCGGDDASAPAGPAHTGSTSTRHPR